MIFNSCDYPEPCDCAECEARRSAKRIAKDVGIIKSAVRKMKPKRKELNRESRKLAIKHHYTDIQSEFYEDNIPTNLFTLFEEFLEAVPTSDLAECNTIGLFEDALAERLKRDGVALKDFKNKKYI